MQSVYCSLASAMLLALSLSGCKKKVTQAPPPPPPVVAETATEPTPAVAEPQPTQPESTAPAAEIVSTPPASQQSFADELDRLQDVRFEYDRSDIRSDAREVLARNADVLRGLFDRFPSGRVRIEGHADERGSAEYNLGLGDRRASMAKEFLAALGVPGDRLATISFGEERPRCTEQHEDCWQRNRRVHFQAE